MEYEIFEYVIQKSAREIATVDLGYAPGRERPPRLDVNPSLVELVYHYRPAQHISGATKLLWAWRRNARIRVAGHIPDTPI
jgi:hypothetical protein